MGFIKTHTRNCFSLNFLLSLHLVELNFSWNNTLVSCPIDFCCKRNKSVWLRSLHLDIVKNKYSSVHYLKNNLDFHVLQSWSSLPLWPAVDMGPSGRGKQCLLWEIIYVSNTEQGINSTHVKRLSLTHTLYPWRTASHGYLPGLQEWAFTIAFI